MRRAIVLMMCFFGLLTIFGGIAESSGSPMFHIVMAVILIALVLVHIWFNRKVMLRYIRNRK